MHEIEIIKLKKTTCTPPPIRHNPKKEKTSHYHKHIYDR